MVIFFIMFKLIVVIVILKFASAFDVGVTASNKMLNFTELTSAAGYQSEVHQTTTEDGYILTLFNIPGNKSRPVLLMHGVMGTGDGFILTKKDSLGFALADQGYDVWFGNHRGNRYNRRHISLDPDSDARFWNFTFHEIGYYDLPAHIDFILNKTGQKQLSAIGYSLGTTIFYVMGSTRPEYNEKIKICISLAPIAYIMNAAHPVSTFMNMEPILSRLTQNQPELFAKNSREAALGFACIKPANHFICKGVIAALTGASQKEMPPNFLNIFQNGFPESVSRKLAQHLAQLKKTFAQYDYGVLGNFLAYNSLMPPEYDLKRCTMKTALFVGAKDRLSVVKDVEILRDKLPNVVEYRVIGTNPYSHIDFIWGKNISTELYSHIFNLLEKYS